MKALMSATAVAGLCWAAAGQAQATYNPVIDLTSLDVSPSGGLNVALPGPAISLLPGQTLTGTITFGPGQAITVTNDPVHSFPAGDEWIYALFSGNDGNNSVLSSSSTMSFLGLTGDYTGPATISSTPSGAGFSFGRLMDLTPTSFSFTGVQFSITYNSGSSTMFTPAGLHSGDGIFSIVNPTIVPEPSTWALLLLGFSGIGLATRRNRRSKRLPQLA